MKRVRFAPSIHLGNALSAVANRNFGDSLLLRIDDTDPSRNVGPELASIVDALPYGEALRRVDAAL